MAYAMFSPGGTFARYRRTRSGPNPTTSPTVPTGGATPNPATSPGVAPTGIAPNAPLAPKPPATSPTAPRQPVPFPLDPAYTTAVGAAQYQLNTTLAGLQYQRQRTQQEYGFDDPSNPYNRAAMLERSFHQSQAGTLNQGASRGQLYSGATQSNLDEGGYQYQRSRSDLRRQYEDMLQQLLQQEAQAKAGFQQTSSGAFGEAVDRQLQNRPEDPAPQQRDPQQGYQRLDQIRAFLKAHPDLRSSDPARYKRLIGEATQLKSWLPSRK